MKDDARRGEIDIASVESWRTHQLIECGYPQEEAFLLGRRTDVDVHQACALLARGCDLSTAVRILT